MIEFFLLDENLVFGDNKLEIFNKYPRSGSPTDYAKDIGTYTYQTSNKDVCDWWLKKDSNKIFGTIVNSDKESKLYVRCTMDGYGIRPAVKFSDIKPFINYPFIEGANVFEIEFGSYPQSVLPNDYQTAMDTLFVMGELGINDDGIYENNGIKALKASYDGKWYLVEPLKWIVDKNANIALCKNVINGGNKTYDKVIEFLKKEFVKTAVPTDNIIQFKKIARYNELMQKKAEIEAELKELDDEIMALRRKK